MGIDFSLLGGTTALPFRAEDMLGVICGEQSPNCCVSSAGRLILGEGAGQNDQLAAFPLRSSPLSRPNSGINCVVELAILLTTLLREYRCPQ